MRLVTIKWSQIGWCVWCSNGMLGIGWMCVWSCHRMYSFCILDWSSLYPCLSPTCVQLFLFFSSSSSHQHSSLCSTYKTQICARTNAHRYNMHTIPIYFRSVSWLDWYLFCVLFPCWCHTITYTIHTCEDLPFQTSSWRDMCLSKTHLT